jgi:hypothetical protein
MNKQQYFDMCEQLNSEPNEAETPVDLEDLPFEVQRAFSLYKILPDIIDGMSGYYGGKDLSSLIVLMQLKEYENKDIIFEFIIFINSVYKEKMNKKRESVVSKS